MERSRGTDISWLHGTTSAPSPPHPHLPCPLTVGSRPMWCTAIDTFCTMWKRSPATVMVLPPLRGQQDLSGSPQPGQ